MVDVDVTVPLQIYRSFDVVSVVGRGATAFLHSQVTADLEALVGSKASTGLLDTLILEPSGKVTALAVCRWSEPEQRWDLFVENGYGPLVIERLRRFFLRVKAEMTISTRRCLLAEVPQTEERVEAPWTGRPLFFLGLELLSDDGDDTHSSSTNEELRSVDVDETSTWEQRRLRFGVPSMSHEVLVERVPASLGPVVLEKAVSLSKGCYTGQELVARMDARQARPPEMLFRARLSLDALPGELSSVSFADLMVDRVQLKDADGGDAGEVTSIVVAEHSELWVLGFLRRSHADDKLLRLVADDVSADLEVVTIES